MADGEEMKGKVLVWVYTSCFRSCYFVISRVIKGFTLVIENEHKMFLWFQCRLKGISNLILILINIFGALLYETLCVLIS